MSFIVALGADHAGFALKEQLTPRLPKTCKILDLGANKLDIKDDYPDFALAVAKTVASGKALRGIIICGSGVGACIVANKVPGIRACLCHDTYSARQGVEHDDMNILCLGARVIGRELAMELVTAFLDAKFCDEPRHRRRLKKVLSIEKSFLKK